MNKIASFTVNHLDLLTGVYVSRKDYIGDVCLTTFDLRFTRPNEEPPMDTQGIHSIETSCCYIFKESTQNGLRKLYISIIWAAEQVFMLYLQEILKSEWIAIVIREAAGLCSFNYDDNTPTWIITKRLW